MQWQLHAEIDPFDSQKDQGDILEGVLACLAGLGLAPDTLARIHAALTNHLGPVNPSVVRVFVSFGQTEMPHPTQRDWRFFIVAPGSLTAADQVEPRLELYLY